MEDCDWVVLPPEFRFWVRNVLQHTGGHPSSGIAMVSEAGTKVLCGLRDWHPLDAPCTKCQRLPSCPVPSMRFTESTERTDWAFRHFPPQDGMPGFHLVRISLSPGTADGLEVPDLAATAAVIHATWSQLWRKMADRLVEESVYSQHGKAIARLASSGAGKKEIENLLDGALRLMENLTTWLAILRDGKRPPVGVPSGLAVTETELEQILSGISKSGKLQIGDYFFVSEGDDLYGLLFPVLTQAQASGSSERIKNILVAPVVVEKGKGTADLGRLWVIFAGFPVAKQPPGPVADQVRMMGQMALIAWDSAHRAEESANRIQLVRESAHLLKGLEELVGESQVIADLKLEILRIKDSDRTVLLVGEQGTGKEVAARLIHRHSPQGDFRHVCVRVAEEIRYIASNLRGLYPANFRLAQILESEFREIPGVHYISQRVKGGRFHAEEPDLKERVMCLADELDSSLRPSFLAIVGMLYKAWRKNPYFNFFEFDAGASSVENVTAELFGVPAERFTSVKERPGRFQTASHCGGTLFLDNVQHLPLAVQKALLKATEVSHKERRVTRSTAAVSEPVHVRIIAATTTGLLTLVNQGTFLGELASRLMTEVIRIPPLRDRRSDIRVLADYFAGLEGKSLAADVPAVLEGVDWRDSNVRGLRSLVESAASRADESVITREDVGNALAALSPGTPVEEVKPEKRMIREVLQDAGGNVTKAAKRLSWSRQKLYRKMKEFGLR